MTAMVALVGTEHKFKTTVALVYDKSAKNCHALFWGTELRKNDLKRVVQPSGKNSDRRFFFTNAFQ